MAAGSNRQALGLVSLGLLDFTSHGKLAMAPPTHQCQAPQSCFAPPVRQRARWRHRACRAVAAPEREVVDRQAAAAPEGLNTWSRHVTQPKSQGASQAMLYATGLREEDMGKAQVLTTTARYLL